MSSHPEKFDKDYNAHKYFDSEGIDYSVKSLSPQELALRNGLMDHMSKNGMDFITDIEEGQRVLDEANGKARLMAFGESYDYDAYPLGRVEPGLADKEVEVVNAASDHGFVNFNEARNWAKQNLSKTYGNEETGGKGDVRISNSAIDKFLSQSAIGKSDDKDVHLAVLRVLPDVLRTSIDVETHPDFLKGEDGKRSVENGMNKDVLVHRCYGAVNIDGKPYRVKITLKENVKTKEATNTHSYEATKIELLAGQHGGVTMTPPRYSNSSITGAKLLENVEMSYNPSEKVLDASEKRAEKPRQLYNPRWYIAPVRGGWTKKKILQRLKTMRGSRFGVGAAAEIISEFDSPQELADHMFYHGTVYGHGRLKPSITMSDRELERVGGGGYGEKYWGVSVSKSKRVASYFSGTSRYVDIYPIILAKGAKVKEMPELEDASELDDHIVDLWTEGVDAVWIGDKNKGEQELCVINPYAIVNIDSPDSYRAFGLGTEKNPIKTIDEAGIEKMYDSAKKYIAEKSTRFATEPKRPLPTDDKSWEQYKQELAEYDRKMEEYRSTEEYRRFEEARAEAKKHIRFFRTPDGEAYGFTIGGKIYVDPRIATTDTPIHEYGHLWTTAVKASDPEKWNNIVDVMKASTAWDEAKKLYPELKSDDDIADEAVNMYSGKRGAERLRQMQEDIAKGDGTATEKAKAIGAINRLKQVLSDFWKSIAKTFGFSKEYRNADEIADAIMSDLLEGVDPRKIATDDRLREQFIGRTGARELDRADYRKTGSLGERDRDLDTAKLMERDGKDAKDIKMATGWERGADGQWRYEIDDATFGDLADKVEKKIKEATENGKSLASVKIAPTTLGKLIGEGHPIIVAYPQLKNTKVAFKDLKSDTRYAQYDWMHNTITINSEFVKLLGLKSELKTSLAHEVQHAIQKIAVFERGGAAEEYGYDKYHRLAGEVEARNVEKRFGMSPEERRASLASETEDVSREDQIFLDHDVDFSKKSSEGENALAKPTEENEGADGMAIYEHWNRAYEEWRNGDRSKPFVSPKFDYRELPTVKDGKRSDLPEELFSHYGEKATEGSEVDFSKKVFGGNSGYVGYSISKRGARAKEEGRFPKGEFKKEYGVTAKAFDALVDLGIIDDSEWHHTSMYGNKTTFYGWDEGALDIYQANKKEIDNLAKDVAKVRELWNKNQMRGIFNFDMRFGDVNDIIENDYKLKAMDEGTYEELRNVDNIRETEGYKKFYEEEMSLRAEMDELKKNAAEAMKRIEEIFEGGDEEPQFSKKTGEEAEKELRSIFAKPVTEELPREISSKDEFNKVFDKPVKSILGEHVAVGEGVYNKIVKNNRQMLTGAIMPTLQQSDFVLKDNDGSNVYAKRFKKPTGESVYNVAVVNKKGELEDYVSSVHIKSDNNLLNKIKNGAELLLPTERTTYGQSPTNSTPSAKVENISETTKGEVDFSVKSPGVERKYQNGVPLKLEGETIPDYVGVLSRSLSRNMGNDAAKETLAKELQEAADKYTTNALRSSELRRLAGDIRVAKKGNLPGLLLEVDQIIGGARVRQALGDLNKTLKTAMTKQNNQGMTVAKGVDEYTRIMFEAINKATDGLLKSGVEAEMGDIRRDIWHTNKDLREAKAALEGAETADEITKWQGKVKELEERKNELKQQLADKKVESKNIIAEKLAMRDDIIDDELRKLDEKYSNAMDGDGVWTESDMARYTGLTLMKPLANEYDRSRHVEDLYEQLDELEKERHELMSQAVEARKAGNEEDAKSLREQANGIKANMEQKMRELWNKNQMRGIFNFDMRFGDVNDIIENDYKLKAMDEGTYEELRNVDNIRETEGYKKFYEEEMSLRAEMDELKKNAAEAMKRIEEIFEGDDEEPQFSKKTGEEAEKELRSIFAKPVTEELPKELLSYEEARKVYKDPITTFLGEKVAVKDGAINKMMNMGRMNLSGAIKPTLEKSDFAIKDIDESTIYVKRFKKPNGESVYNVAVVNKKGELEDYIGSVHIKSDNNLLNKIKNGAELLRPNIVGSYEKQVPGNPTPSAKVENISEATKSEEVDFSVKSPGVERKYQNGVPLKLEGETIPDYVGVLSKSLSRNMGNDAAKETLAKELQEAADKYTTNELRSTELRRLAGDILATRKAHNRSNKNEHSKLVHRLALT